MAREIIAAPPKGLSLTVFVAGALLLSAATVACQKQDDHPPLAAGCEVDCKAMPPISIGVGSAGGSGSTGTDAGINAGTLTGNVALYNDDTFKTAALFTGTATVSADGSTISPVTSTWDGSTPYSLTGVKVTDTNWVGAKPDDPTLAFWTYHAVQTNAVDTVDLPLVQTTTLQQIYSTLTVVAEPATGAGQVVLTLFDAATQAPFSGLKAILPAAQFIAYSQNGAWTEDDTATTGNSGLVILGNVTAGAATTLTVSLTGAATGQFSVKVVPNAVTVVSVNVQR